MGKFKVSYPHGSGHDDLDEENEHGEFGPPRVYEFDTEAEMRAFLLGVDDTAEVMNGYAEAWVATKRLT